MEVSKVPDTSRSYEEIRFREIGAYYSYTFKSFRREWWMARETKHCCGFSTHRFQFETIFGGG